jgi:hypothetical protein
VSDAASTSGAMIDHLSSARLLGYRSTSGPGHCFCSVFVGPHGNASRAFAHQATKLKASNEVSNRLLGVWIAKIKLLNKNFRLWHHLQLWSCRIHRVTFFD